jgi:gamma-glutamyl phosphate reductase
MDRKMSAEELRANLEYGLKAEKVILHAVDLIREADPKAAQKLLENPDYIELLVTRTKLEARLKELESEA